MGKDKRRKKFVEETSQFSKTDMQRLGVFKEGGYISIGDPYRRAKSEYLIYTVGHKKEPTYFCL